MQHLHPSDFSALAEVPTVPARPIPPESLYKTIIEAARAYVAATDCLKNTPKPEAPTAISSAEAFAAWHSAKWEHAEAVTRVEDAHRRLVEVIPSELAGVYFKLNEDVSFKLAKARNIVLEILY